LVNISRLGRQWFGESFDFKSEQEFSYFSNIDTSTPLKIRTTLAAAAFTQLVSQPPMTKVVQMLVQQFHQIQK
jgi:hypothetical protein